MRITLLAAVLALALPASAQDMPAPESSDASIADASIVTVLQQDGRFTTLLSALETAGLTQTLTEPGPFTLFAPTDSAFAALPEGTLASLTPEQLQGVLLGHVVSGAVTSNQAYEAGEASTAWGDRTLTFTETDGGLAVDGTPIVQADLAASNGVIHVIGGVLLSPTDDAGMDAGDLDDGQMDDDGGMDDGSDG